jgi:hypothetical protein
MFNQGEICLFPSTISENSKYSGKTAVMLNQEALKTVHDFFYHEEIGIDSAVRMLYDTAMQGGVELMWGDAFSLKLSADEQRNAQNISMTALDWKKMFGFCPIKRVLPKKEGETARFEIPDFGTGAFFMLYDNDTHQSELKFMPYRYGNKSKKGLENKKTPNAIRNLTKNGREAVNTNELKFPKNYFVFVWPRMKPTLHNGFLKTVTSKLLQHWSVTKQLQSNLLINDTWRSMPPLITKRPVVNQKLSDLTEAEAFGEEELIEPDPLMQKKYQRDAASEANNQQKAHGFRSRREKTGANQMVMFNTTTGRFEIDTLKHMCDPENIFDLEEGMQIDRLDNTTTTAMYLNLKHDYEDLVDRTFGVDRSSHGGGSSSRLKVNAEQNRQLLEILVADERASASLFYATAYEFVHRDNDNVRISEIRAHIDDEIESLQQKMLVDSQNHDDKLRIAELQKQKKATAKLAKQDLRLKLSFPKNPFGKSLDPQTINLLIEQKVLTPLEEINMLRSIGNFEPLSKDHELVRERIVMRDLEDTQKEEELSISPLEQAEAEMKAKTNKATPKPASSAAPKKRKAEEVPSSDSKKKK